MPRKELDQAGVDLTNARNQYEIAQQHLDALMKVGRQQQLKAAAGQLESAKGKYLGSAAQLSYSEIRSPMDGVVADRPLYPGEMAAAGAPLLTVMDISQVIARAHIPQPEAALLKVGDQATVTVPGRDNPIEGKITVVSPALDPNSTTVEIWVQIKNVDQRLKPGTSAQVSMLAQTVPDALIIPCCGAVNRAGRHDLGHAGQRRRSRIPQKRTRGHSSGRYGADHRRSASCRPRGRFRGLWPAGQEQDQSGKPE